MKEMLRNSGCHGCKSLKTDKSRWVSNLKINTYSMKQPDLYYFEAIRVTLQA